MPLDGFVTGPDAGPDNGLGTGGGPLHDWAVGRDDEGPRCSPGRTTPKATHLVYDVVG